MRPGFGLGVVTGVVVGVVLGTWKLGAALLEPLLAAVNGIPKVALAPLFLLWFGIGMGSKIAIAAMTVRTQRNRPVRFPRGLLRHRLADGPGPDWRRSGVGPRTSAATLAASLTAPNSLNPS